MTKIYSKTFGVTADDRERDSALAARMAALAFVRPEHLDIPELYQDQKAWLLAIKELHKINNYKVCETELLSLHRSIMEAEREAGNERSVHLAPKRLMYLSERRVCSGAALLARHLLWVAQAPRDKLVCILNCCRVINNLLHVGIQDGQARGEAIAAGSLPAFPSRAGRISAARPHNFHMVR